MNTPLLALALAALQAPEPAPQTLHPDGVDLVLMLPDLPAVLDAFDSTALARTLADEELHEALGDVMGSGPVDPVELMAQQLRDLGWLFPPILDQHEGFRSISLSVDLGGDGGGSLTSLLGGEDGGAAASDREVRLVIDFVDEAASEAVARGLDASLRGDEAGDLSTRAVNLPGDGGAFGSPRLTVVELSDSGDGRVGHLAHGGTRVLVGRGIDDIDGELLRLSRAAPEACSSKIVAGRARLGAAEGTTLMEFYISPDAGVSAQMEAAIGVEAMTMAGPLATMMEMMLGALGTAVFRGGHWRVDIQQDGRYLTNGWVPGPSSLPSSEVFGGSALDPASLTLAHPDALVTSVASFDPEQLLEFLVQLPEGANDVETEEAMQEMDTRFGFRVDRDLIDPLGGSISCSLPRLRSLLSAPNLMAVASLDDRGAFTRGMDGLMALMEEAGDVDGQRTDYRGATLYTLSGGSGGMQGSPLPVDLSEITRPTLTVMDDRVLISTLPSHAKREVRRVAKLIKAGEEAELHARLSAIELSGTVTMVSSADWPVFCGNLYTQLRALAPLLLNLADDGAGAAGVDSDLPLPFKLDALPDMGLITRHFAPSERSWVKVEDGFVDTSISSLGPELPALLIGAGLVGLFTVQEEALLIADEGALPDADEGAEVEAPLDDGSNGAEMSTRFQLLSLRHAVLAYQIDHDAALPASLAELTKTEEGKQAYFSGDLEDGWGRAVRYRITEEGYRLWSVGSNGVDEEGEGDDLLHTSAR
ncbi:MAG: hypothetical protein ACPGPE_01755 [Planctomycetota bacterium]